MTLTALLAIVILFSQCSTNKAIGTNTDLASHPQPLKVFSVGTWQPGVVVVTFIDANDEYFTVLKSANDSFLKKHIVIHSK